MDFDAINLILKDYFNTNNLTSQEKSLLNLYYPEADSSTCSTLQGVLFTLNYRNSHDTCSNFDQATLDKLIENSGCELDYNLPEYTNQAQFLVLGYVK